MARRRHCRGVMLALRRSAFAFAPVFALLVLPGGCSAGATPGGLHLEGEGAPGERTATTSSAITSDDAISRATQWVTAELLYCQSPEGQPDPDTSCPSVCNRESNPEWNPYRSDCSGFVSWAWGLAAPGLVTSEFAPFDTSVSTTIQASDLQPGDACNLTAGGHIVLFVQWVTPGQSAVFMEEPGCSATPDYAHEFTSDVTINGVNIDIAYEGESFTAIRYTQMTESPADAGAGADAGSGGDDASQEETGVPHEDAGGGSSSGGGSSGGGSSGGGSGSSGAGGGSSGAGGSSGGSGVTNGGGKTPDAGAPGEGNGATPGGTTGSPFGGSSGGCDVAVGGIGGTDAAMGLLVLGLAFVRRRRRS